MTIIVRLSNNNLSPLGASLTLLTIENLVLGGDGFLLWVAKYKDSLISEEINFKVDQKAYIDLPTIDD